MTGSGRLESRAAEFSGHSFRKTQPGPTRASPLIDVAGLAASLAGPRAPTLLDVRWQLGAPPGMELYREGHIPGARFVDLDRELAAPPGAGGRHPLPEATVFGAAMRAAGVAPARPVVAYDGGETVAAARAWWLLRYFGHTRVAVLDGGLAAWTAAGHGLAHGSEPRPEPGDFAPVPGQMPLLDATAAARVATAGLLLDARTPERFAGEREPIDPVAGHIPGARNVPAAAHRDPAGRFLGPEELRARFDRLGAAGAGEIGAYCGSGVTAAQTVLALELAGYRGALYAGSWSEWILDRGRPVSRGNEAYGGQAHDHRPGG
jgi:thiosulfate/3-mercaptopyruvate sulfurtransferase